MDILKIEHSLENTETISFIVKIHVIQRENMGRKPIDHKITHKTMDTLTNFDVSKLGSVM